jgi:hypothetical protein
MNKVLKYIAIFSLLAINLSLFAQGNSGNQGTGQNGNPCKPIKIVGPVQSDALSEELYTIDDQYNCGNMGYKWKFEGAELVNGQPAGSYQNNELVTQNNELRVKWSAQANVAKLTAETVDPCNRGEQCSKNNKLYIKINSNSLGTITGPNICVNEVAATYKFNFSSRIRLCNNQIVSYNWEISGGKFVDNGGNIITNSSFLNTSTNLINIKWDGNSAGTIFCIGVISCNIIEYFEDADFTLPLNQIAVREDMVGSNFNIIQPGFGQTNCTCSFEANSVSISRPACANTTVWSFNLINPKSSSTTTYNSSTGIETITDLHSTSHCSKDIIYTAKNSCQTNTITRIRNFPSNFFELNNIEIKNQCVGNEHVIKTNDDTWVDNSGYIFDILDNSTAYFVSHDACGVVSNSAKRYSTDNYNTCIYPKNQAFINLNGNSTVRISVKKRYQVSCNTPYSCPVERLINFIPGRIIADKCYQVEQPVVINFENINFDSYYRYKVYRNNSRIKTGIFKYINMPVDILTETENDVKSNNYRVEIESYCDSLINIQKSFRVVDFQGDPQPTNCFDFEAKLAYNEEAKEQMVEIMPNPTDGIIEIKTFGIDNSLKFEIFDISGRIIYSGFENKIDLTKEPIGIYYLRTSSIDFIQTKKIIITK